MHENDDGSIHEISKLVQIVFLPRCFLTGYTCGPAPASRRRKICSWIGSHPNEVIAGSSVKEWVLWDTNKTVSAYVARVCLAGTLAQSPRAFPCVHSMLVRVVGENVLTDTKIFMLWLLLCAKMQMSKPGCWGGGIEMAACSRLFNINVHVYEIDRPEGEAPRFKRISCFNAAELAKEAKEAKEAAKGKAEIVAASTWSRPRSPRSLSPRTPRSSRFATPTKPGLGGARPGAGPSSRPEVSRVGSKRGTSGSGSGNGGGRPSNSARPSAEEPPGGTTKDQPAGVAPVPLGTAAATIAAVVGAADPSAVDAAGGATSLPEAAAAAAAAEVDNYPTVHVLYGGGIHFDVLLPGRDGKASSLRSSSTSGGALEARSPRLPSALGAAPRSPRPSPPPGGGTGPPGSGLLTPIRKPRLPASSLSARPLPSVRVPLGSRAASGSVSNSPRKPASTPKISGSGGGEASADAGRALLATGLSVPVSPIKPSGAQSRIF